MTQTVGKTYVILCNVTRITRDSSTKDAHYSLRFTNLIVDLIVAQLDRIVRI